MHSRGWPFLIIGLVAGLLVAQLAAALAQPGSGMMGSTMRMMGGGMMGSGMMGGGMMRSMHGQAGDCPMMGQADHAAMMQMCTQMAAGRGMAECAALMGQEGYGPEQCPMLSAGR